MNYAPAADRNKGPIWQVLKTYLPSNQKVLEIASGSGQHALYFTQQNPELIWQCTEMSSERNALQINLNELGAVTFPPIKTLDVLDGRDVAEIQTLSPFDCVYTSNSLHIMSWQGCQAFMKLVSEVLGKGGVCAIYGPFFYNDQPPVVSNLEFDAWLKNRNPESGVRQFSDVAEAFGEVGMTCRSDHAMPANNRLLVFQKD
nr:DUF938 domain-containing protein [Litoribrevibacter albus]